MGGLISPVAFGARAVGSGDIAASRAHCTVCCVRPTKRHLVHIERAAVAELGSWEGLYFGATRPSRLARQLRRAHHPASWRASFDDYLKMDAGVLRAHRIRRVVDTKFQCLQAGAKEDLHMSRFYRDSVFSPGQRSSGYESSERGARLIIRPKLCTSFD